MLVFLIIDSTRVNGGPVSKKNELTRHSRVGRALRMCVHVRCEVNWELSVSFLRGVNWSSCSTALVLSSANSWSWQCLCVCVRLCFWSFLWRITGGQCIRWIIVVACAKYLTCAVCVVAYSFSVEIATSCITRTSSKIVFFTIGNF